MTGILKVGADVDAFREAVEAFCKRFAIKSSDLLALGQYAHDRAFTLAGATHLAVIETVRQSLLDAVEHGTPLDEWRKAITETLRREFGRRQPREGLPTRLETIYRNAVQKAYNAGRHQQMTTPTMVAIRPYWLLDVILDLRTSEICDALGRPPVCLPIGDPFWAAHWPPLHHRCRTVVRALRRREAQGRVRQPPPDAPDVVGDWGRPPEAETPWRPEVPEAAQPGWVAGQDRTPPRPAAVEVGRHVIETRGDSEAVQDILRAWEAAGVAPGLERRAVTRLVLTDKPIPYSGGTTAGLYDLRERTVRVWKGFTPGSATHLAGQAINVSEARRLLALHELGHHFESSDWISDVEIRWCFGKASPVTPYAATNPSEWFAECFALYFTNMAKLKDRDPEGYEVVRMALLYYGCLQ